MRFAMFLAVLLLGLGCNGQPATAPDRSAAPEVPKVKVVRVEKQDVRRPIERPGYNTEAYERTLLYARIAGYVRKWNGDMGQRVKKDDLLVELYVPELHVELKQKEARMRQSSAEIEQTKASLRRAQAEIERAKSQYERLAKVGRSGVLDKDQVDEVYLGYKAADAALAKAKADVSVAEARLEVAVADRNQVQAMLEYTMIRAPFDGLITGRRTISIGDLVQPGAATANKGDALFIVENVSPMRVFVNVQELEAAWVRVGDTALVRPQSLPGQEFKGTVTRTAGALHPQNRTLLTEIDLPNPEGKLTSGMYVTVTIIAEHKNVWALPTASVVTQNDQTFCYRVQDAKALRTPIKVGLRGKELVEVLQTQTKSAGQSAWRDITGEEVVAADPASVSDGQTVRIDDEIANGNK